MGETYGCGTPGDLVIITEIAQPVLSDAGGVGNQLFINKSSTIKKVLPMKPALQKKLCHLKPAEESSQAVSFEDNLGITV